MRKIIAVSFIAVPLVLASSAAFAQGKWQRYSKCYTGGSGNCMSDCVNRSKISKSTCRSHCSRSC